MTNITSTWDATSFEDRCAILRKCFPFDYLLTPKPFMQAATQGFDTLPLNLQAAVRSELELRCFNESIEQEHIRLIFGRVK
jgi:hypothetical protein